MFLSNSNSGSGLHSYAGQAFQPDEVHAKDYFLIVYWPPTQPIDAMADLKFIIALDYLLQD